MQCFDRAEWPLVLSQFAGCRLKRKTLGNSVNSKNRCIATNTKTGNRKSKYKETWNEDIRRKISQHDKGRRETQSINIQGNEARGKQVEDAARRNQG